MPKTDCNTRPFNLSSTAVCKGVACMMLLIHHLYSWNYSVLFKVCVSVFIILSGYGMNESYQRHFKEQKNDHSIYSKEDLDFIIAHLLKFMRSYWMIFAVFALIGTVSGARTFPAAYQGHYLGLLGDLLGIGYLFNNINIFNPTWWYMTFFVTSGLLYPLIRKIMNRSCRLVVLIGSVLYLLAVLYRYNLDACLWLIYYLNFLIGCWLSETDLLNQAVIKLSERKTAGILCSVLLLALTVAARRRFGALADPLYALAVILFSELCLKPISPLKSVFSYIGRYSGDIFLVHTLLQQYFLHDFIYSSANPLLMMAKLLGVSLACSITIEYLVSLFLRLRRTAAV